MLRNVSLIMRVGKGTPLSPSRYNHVEPNPDEQFGDVDFKR